MSTYSRRRFVQMGSLASASFFVPKFLKAFERKAIAENKILVVLQLSGGNDGLNTVIPYNNDIYYASRPVLGIKKNDVLKMDAEQGLHPCLTGLKTLYDNGEMALLNGVGYPNPNRSHFRSMDIWQTASDSETVINTGWIGRYLDAQCKISDKPTLTLEIDDTLSLALKGKNNTGLAVNNPTQFYGDSHDSFFKAILQKHPVNDEHLNVDYLYKTLAESMSSADYIYQQSKIYKSNTTYPNTNIGKDLKTIAELINSHIDTKIYYVSLSGFDTHVNQHPQQQKLFTELSGAVDAFVKDLKSGNRFKDVMLMTFSEFGRRVSQNASGGTDHGTANCMFLVSGGLKKQGILNTAPNLADLDQGDLKYQIDFKDVYATMLHNWLKTDDTHILNRQNSYLNFI